MKIIIFTIMILISSPSIAWFFGGFDLEEMKEIQEKAYQEGRSCQRGDYLDACSNFIKSYKHVADIFEDHQDEIYEKSKKGDSNYDQVIHNVKRLTRLAESIN